MCKSVVSAILFVIQTILKQTRFYSVYNMNAPIYRLVANIHCLEMAFYVLNIITYSAFILQLH